MKELILTITIGLLTTLPLSAQEAPDTFCLENQRVKAFMDEVTYTAASTTQVANYNVAPPARRDQPQGVSLSWTAPTATLLSQYIDISTSADLSDAQRTVLNRSDTTATIYNLTPARTYYYKVSGTDNGGLSVNVASGQFLTTGRVRMIQAPSLSNVRDLGGWSTTDGHTVQYGLLYRGDEMNNLHTISTADITTLRNLGIAADLDLRTDDEAADITASPLGTDIDYRRVNNSVYYVKGITAAIPNYKKDFDFILQELKAGQPVYIHCIYGVDRTGTLCFLLEGLLGLSESDLYKEYELSVFAYYPAAGNARDKSWLTDCMNYIKTFNGFTLQAQFIDYWHRHVGISYDDLNTFRNLMLGTDFSTAITFNPTKTLGNAATLTLAAGESCDLQAATAPQGRNGQITFTSSDKTVATVTADGIITAVGMGTAIVTASLDGMEESVTVEVGTNIAPLSNSITASYTASWNYLYAINDGVTGYGELANAQTWGSWQNSRPATSWLAYSWSKTHTVSSSRVFFWTDTENEGTGVNLPKSWKLQYYDDTAGAWKDVTLLSGQSYPLNRTAPNVVAFEPVETSQLRLWMNARGSGSYSALGVTEWEVFADEAGGSTADEEFGDYPIENVDFSRVHLDDGFWSPRMEQNQSVTIPIALEQCWNTGRVDNFLKAAGKMAGWFNTENTFDDTDIYKILEGMSYSVQNHPNAALEAEMDTLIQIIADAQEPDGYLYTPRTAGEPGNYHSWVGPERWEYDPNLSHELYNCGHLYEAAVAHYISTGKRTLLDVAIKNADLLVHDFLEGGLTYEPGHQIVEMGLVKMYRVTGKTDYLRLAKYFLDLRGSRGVARKEYSQTHKPVVMQDEAVGHAVRAGYMYSGMADVAAIMQEDDYLSAIDRIWDNVNEKKLYITGGIGALHDGEAFGANYELPNLTAYCETCAAISNVYWNWRMFLLHGDSKYYDIIERTLYNGVISGISLSGDRFFYPNPLASDGTYERSAWFGCACCPSNLCRFIASVPGYMYAHRDDSIYVNLYAQGTASVPMTDGNVVLTQSTQYPWDGDITITIDSIPAADFVLKLRLPGWAQGKPVPSDLYSYLNAETANVSVSINGSPTAYTLEQGYMTFNRQWSIGDVISFSLPMDVHKSVANTQVTADAGLIELERGPIVYCLEWPDNADCASAIVPDDATVETSTATIVDNTFVSLVIAGQKARLQADGSVAAENATLTAIPYYAWANRGKGYMSVWIARTADKATASLGDVEQTDTLHYEVEEIPFRNASAKTYDSTPVQIDTEAAAESLGVSVSDLTSLLGSTILFTGIDPDGTVTTTSTANDPGHWFDTNGNVTKFAGSPCIFSELDKSTFACNIGQYPNACRAGESYVIRQALTYLPGIAGSQMRRVVFEFHVNIVASFDHIQADTLRYEVNEVPFTNTAAAIYDSTPVSIDRAATADILGVASTALASGITNGTLIYAAVEPDGSVNTTSTANAPGHWFAADGYTCTFSSGSATIFSELDQSALAVNIGQYPARCSMGDSYVIRQALTTAAAADDGYLRRCVFEFHINITDPTAIAAVGQTTTVTVIAVYTPAGIRIASPQPGINILRMSDGSSRKVIF